MAKPLDYLEIARRVIRNRAQPPADEKVATDHALRAALESAELVLKGHAVELWANSTGRLFLVADEEDARLAMERFRAPRGETYSVAEARCIVGVGDPEVVTEIHKWKRRFDGTVRECRRRPENAET